jgi:hypothetical protein
MAILSSSTVELEKSLSSEHPPPTSKCTSRPDCPCDFCVRVHAEIAEGRSGKDKENQLAEDFLRSCADRARGEEMVKKSVPLAPEDSTESETIESDVWKIQGPGVPVRLPGFLARQAES